MSTLTAMMISDAKEKLNASDLIIISFMNWRMQTAIKDPTMIMNMLRTFVEC